MRPEHRAAIARVDVPREEAAPSRGTAFLVAPGLALTALHVVAERRGGAAVFHAGPIRLTFPGGASLATVVAERFDAVADWALLELQTPPAALSLPLAETLREREPFETFGFPDLRPEGDHFAGEVQDLSGFAETPPLVRLSSAQLKREAVSGLSGAPVLVDGAVVAMISASLLDKAKENRAGLLYAVPLWAIAGRCGDRLPVPDPLRGLPGLPHRPLPVDPFRYLARFGEADAEVFFGRGAPLRELYRRLTEPEAERLLLFYGQSGVGKSSLLEAGLVPRLAGTHDVRVVRRDAEVGLPGTLRAALEAPATRPLVVVLDQAEEAFTREGPADELERLAASLGDLPPGVRVALSFRKEWLPEIEKALTGLSYGRLFVDRIDRAGIVDVVEGLTRTRRSQDFYRLTVEPGLASMIADDLLDDPQSPVAPMLQILLTRTWEEARRQDAERPRFTVDRYRALKARGLHLDDFFHQQAKALESQLPDVVRSGLALDVLAFHTTSLGTALGRSAAEIHSTYSHLPALIGRVIQSALDLYLLVDEPGGGTRLAHDTLAPVVRREMEASDRPGQRARRIVESRAVDWRDGRRAEPLDRADYARVAAGLTGMRDLLPDERRLIAASRHAVERTRRAVFAVRAALAVLAVMVAAASVFLWQWNQDLVASRRALSTQLAENQFAAARTAAEQRQDVLSELHHLSTALGSALPGDPRRAVWTDRLLAVAPMAPTLVADFGPVHSGAVDGVGRAFLLFRPDNTLQIAGFGQPKLPPELGPRVGLRPLSHATFGAAGRFAAVELSGRVVAWEVATGEKLVDESFPPLLKPLSLLVGGEVDGDSTGDRGYDDELYSTRLAFGADGWLTYVRQGGELLAWHLEARPVERRTAVSSPAVGALAIAPSSAGRPWVPVLRGSRLHLVDLRSPEVSVVDAEVRPPAARAAARPSRGMPAADPGSPDVARPDVPPPVGPPPESGPPEGRPPGARHAYVRLRWWPRPDGALLVVGHDGGPWWAQWRCDAEGCEALDHLPGDLPPWALDEGIAGCERWGADRPQPAVTSEGLVREWDVRARAAAWPERRVPGRLRAAGWSDDGRTLYTLSANGHLLAWPLAPARPGLPLQVELPAPAVGAAFDAAGERVAVIGGDRADARLVVVDAHDGRPRWAAPLAVSGGLYTRPLVAGFSADGQVLHVVRWLDRDTWSVEHRAAVDGAPGRTDELPGLVWDSASWADGVLRIAHEVSAGVSDAVEVRSIDRGSGTASTCPLPGAATRARFTRAPGHVVARTADDVEVRRTSDCAVLAALGHRGVPQIADFLEVALTTAASLDWGRGSTVRVRFDSGVEWRLGSEEDPAPGPTAAERIADVAWRFGGEDVTRSPSEPGPRLNLPDVVATRWTYTATDGARAATVRPAEPDTGSDCHEIWELYSGARLAGPACFAGVRGVTPAAVFARDGALVTVDAHGAIHRIASGGAAAASGAWAAGTSEAIAAARLPAGLLAPPDPEAHARWRAEVEAAAKSGDAAAARMLEILAARAD